MKIDYKFNNETEANEAFFNWRSKYFNMDTCPKFKISHVTLVGASNDPEDNDWEEKMILHLDLVKE